MKFTKSQLEALDRASRGELFSIPIRRRVGGAYNRMVERLKKDGLISLRTNLLTEKGEKALQQAKKLKGKP